MIKCEITIVKNNDFNTVLYGNSIEEVIEKIKEFHTMSEFERQHYEKKGTLKKMMSLGWWLSEETT